jgi:hypothetical protein
VRPETVDAAPFERGDDRGMERLRGRADPGRTSGESSARDDAVEVLTREVVERGARVRRADARRRGSADRSRLREEAEAWAEPGTPERTRP